MTRPSFAEARERLRQHLLPLGSDLTRESPNTLLARVYDPVSGETLLTVTGIACPSRFTDADIERIIRVVESDLELVQLQTRLPPSA